MNERRSFQPESSSQSGQFLQRSRCHFMVPSGINFISCRLLENPLRKNRCTGTLALLGKFPLLGHYSSVKVLKLTK